MCTPEMLRSHPEAAKTRAGKLTRRLRGTTFKITNTLHWTVQLSAHGREQLSDMPQLAALSSQLSAPERLYSSSPISDTVIIPIIRGAIAFTPTALFA